MNDALWVLWWPSGRSDIAARGYWDQAMLEDVLAGLVWHPTSPVDVHHVYDPDDVPTDAHVVVVVPARHHAAPAQVDAIARAVLRYRHAVVVLTGDEEHAFPVAAFNGRALCTTWVQNPSLDVARSSDRVLGCGYTTHARTEALRVEADEASARDAWWAYAGQSAPHRSSFERHARGLATSHPSRTGTVVFTPGFTQGLPRDEYASVLRHARAVPAPCGPAVPDTFRLFEALELGCVPIADEPGVPGYWAALLGGDPPFPVVHDWTELGAEVLRAGGSWPWSGAVALAWWTRWKVDMARRLWADALPGRQRTVDDDITVLIPTSTTPHDPDTGIIEDTITSVRRYLPTARIIVMADGVRTEQVEARLRQYTEYVYRLAWSANTRWRNVEVVPFVTHRHQGVMARTVMRDMVTTPYVLYVEHDTPLVGDIDMAHVVRPLASGAANLVRFHHEAAVHPEHAWLSPSTDVQTVEGVPLIATMQWSQRPHLARSAFYRDVLDTYFGWESRTMIEDVMHGVLEVDWRTRGAMAWHQWRTWLYAPNGSMVRSRHSDGRAGDPKFDMLYAYDGVTPHGAPTPTADR